MYKVAFVISLAIAAVYGAKIKPTDVGCNCNAHGVKDNDLTCDSFSGQCNCECYTVGKNCDTCKEGHFNFTHTPPCEHECLCNMHGTVKDTICDPITGQCECKDKEKGLIVGRQCDKCKYGYCGYPMCEPCGCSEEGSKNIGCDEKTGMCDCKVNYRGLKCKECKNGYYNYPECKDCMCDLGGSINNDCNIETGKCTCKHKYVIGDKCEKCMEGYYKHPECKDCECDVMGSKGVACDDDGKCICKEKVEGDKCKICIKDHYGWPNCKACSCNMKGSKKTACDLKTGQCDCLKANITGILCDRCVPGCYSFPECPACQCDIDGSIGITCDDDGKCKCKPHVIGAKCNECEDGYYDHPHCMECGCYDKGTLVDTDCDKKTGQCTCKEGYIGKDCDKCAPGYKKTYDADDNLMCEPCKCKEHGTKKDTYCNQETGQCDCHDNFEGIYCEKCSPGHYMYPHCKPCMCDENGSNNYTLCDVVTGQCDCKTKMITGRDCKKCEQSYYKFPDCKECGCSIEGSKSEACDDKTGLCSCKECYTDEKCDKCKAGYFGYPNCEACNCHKLGSKNQMCNVITGQCDCKTAMISGRACDGCGNGYFGFPMCEKCICSSTGTKLNTPCNSASGQCACREGFCGQSCDKCCPGYYNHPDCTPCTCNRDGTSDEICDLESGCCDCKDGVIGEKCQFCSPGKYGFPECKDCACNAIGRLNNHCNEDTGCCRCKEGFGGDLCDKCADGKYGFPTCQDCSCDPNGSVSEVCDDLGKCKCRDGFAGDTCNECAPGRTNFPECCADTVVKGCADDKTACAKNKNGLTACFADLCVVPVEEPSCKDDANACAANNNGKTACFGGECVVPVEEDDCSNNSTICAGNTNGCIACFNGECVIPIEVDDCSSDGGACAANTNGCTACFNGECVVPVEVTSCLYDANACKNNTNGLNVCLDGKCVSADKCEIPKFIGDGYCDDENNKEACNFDQGDCCPGKHVEVKKDYCTVCACLGDSGAGSNDKTLVKVGSLASYAKGVSGDVYKKEAKNMLVVNNFKYDGSAPDAFFIVGTSAKPSSDGTILPYPFDGTFYQYNDKSAPKLAKADGKQVILTLPSNLKVSDVKWLAVWCRQFGLNFGDLYFQGTTTEQPSITTSFFDGGTFFSNSFEDCAYADGYTVAEGSNGAWTCVLNETPGSEKGIQSCDLVAKKCKCKEGYTGKFCGSYKDGGSLFSNSFTAKEAATTTPSTATVLAEVCPPGYTGETCNQCESGYEVTSDWKCQNQYFSKQIPKEGIISCDLVAQKCKCKEGYGGTQCQICPTGHYRALVVDFARCEPCNCNEKGTKPNTTCNYFTGKCDCLDNYTGDKCTRCKGLEHCNLEGIGEDIDCDKNPKGKCVCLEGYIGDKCDQCDTANGFARTFKKKSGKNFATQKIVPICVKSEDVDEDYNAKYGLLFG